MNESETHIMRHFRLYGVRANQMLCFNGGLAKTNPANFRTAMASLIRRGFVVAERARDAYTLTDEGYTALRSV